jgi:ankyrin repeat protein
LHFASKHGHSFLLPFLIENGAEVNAVNNKLNTPLHKAASHGNGECVRILLDNQAYVNCRNHKLSTPLHHAVSKNDSFSCAVLLEKGADPSIKNKDQKTAVSMDKTGNCASLINKYCKYRCVEDCIGDSIATL